MHVEPVLRNVDANETHIHPLPSLSKRASSFAAQATVRGRWNGGRGPLLPRGLGVPVGTRSPSRHRTRNNSRCGGRQVTRGTTGGGGGGAGGSTLTWNLPTGGRGSKRPCRAPIPDTPFARV